MRRETYIFALLTLPLLLAFAACREDELVVPTEYEIIGDEASGSPVRGFYLVNEGNMGSNKCSLDYYDYYTGLYSRNFYSEKNPAVVKELGDVGNDIGIYGSKLYVVVNCSHKVEVMDARSGVRIGQVYIPNCRYVRSIEARRMSAPTSDRCLSTQARRRARSSRSTRRRLP